MFEFVRRFQKWVMVGTVILVSFAFGITGVVYSVLAPSRGPSNQELGTYSLSAVKGTDSRVTVKQREFKSFKRRWNDFLIDRISRAQLLFGRMMQRPWSDRMIQMVMQLSMRQDPFFRFFPYVQSQYRVDFLRNLVFLRSGGDALESKDVRMTPPLSSDELSNMDRSQKTRERWEDWSEEVYWRLMYFRDLAREAGFSATDEEIADLVKPFLNRMSKQSKSRISYSDFVQSQARMGVEPFETTVKELISILKFLGSISRTSALEKENLLDGFQEDLGSVALLVSNIDHNRVQEEVYADRQWRMRQRILDLHPTEDTVDSFSAFLSELGNDNSDQRPRTSNGGEGEASFEKRQFAYLFLPLTTYFEKTDAPSEDRVRSYYENNKSEFQKNGGSTEEEQENGEREAQEKQKGDEVLPFEQVRDNIRKKIHRKRALRLADKDLQKLINTTISRKEIREQPVDFQQLANEGDLAEQLEYRTSPLLDREDMTFYLREMQGVEGAQLDNVLQFIFDRSLSEASPYDTYLKESVWFKNGVVLPRLIRVESNVMSPSFQAAGNGQEATNWELSEFSDRYPIPSLQLKEALQRRKLKRIANQRAKQLQQQLAGQYKRRRDELWNSNDVYGPPVPARFVANQNSTNAESDSSGDGTSGRDEALWPPVSFSNESIDQNIHFQRRKWKRAKAAFEQIASRAGLEVHVTEPFKLDEGPGEVDVQQSVLNRIRSTRQQGPPRGRGQAELFEPITGNNENQSQVAVLYKKITKSGADLEAFLSEQRRAKVQSARSSQLRNHLIPLIEQSDFSLANSSQEGAQSEQ